MATHGYMHKFTGKQQNKGKREKKSKTTSKGTGTLKGCIHSTAN